MAEAGEDARGVSSLKQSRSVSIAFAIIDAIAANPDSGPSAVARQTGISKSTASTVLSALAARGVLERTGSGRYRLGIRMFEYGHLALTQVSLFEAGVPVLERLRDRLRDMVQLAVPMGSEVLYLDRLEAQTLDSRFHDGTWRRLPAHASGSGRAIAAFNPEITQAILSAGLKRWTRYTLVDPQRLLVILDEIRSTGYASAGDELEEGITSVAAPIFSGDGAGRRAIAAVSVVGPSDRLRREGIAELAAHVKQAATEISLRLERGLRAA